MKLSTAAFSVLFLSAIQSAAQWHLIGPDLHADWRSVYFINDSVGFIVGNLNEHSYVLKTENYGTSWDTVMHETTTFYYDIHFPTEDIGYVSTYHNLLKTINSGETWNYPNPDLDLFSYWGILFLDEDLGLGCFADGGAVMAKTTNGGLDWLEDETVGAKQIIQLEDCTVRAISNQLYMKSVNCGDDWEVSFMSIDNNRTFPSLDNSSQGILACGIGSNGQIFNFNYGTVAQSSDDGETWDVQDFPHAWQYHSIYFPSDQVGYCVGEAFETFPDVILKSIDGGHSWNYQEYDLLPNSENPNFLDVYCPSDTVCYAVGYSGQVYRTINGGGEFLEPAYSVSVEDFHEKNFLVYPNPIADVISIQGISSGVFFESRIMDSSGRILAVSTNKTEIDVSALAPGIYFLQIIGQTNLVVTWIKE